MAEAGNGTGAGTVTSTAAKGHKGAVAETDVLAGGHSGKEGGTGPGGGWLQGAALLGAAALASKVLGTVQKIPLQNLAGDRVFGLYSAVYPFYQLLLFLAAAGIPAALSLLAAERAAGGDAAEAGPGPERLLGTAAVLLAVSGAAGFALLWLGADRAAGWIGDPAAAAAIRASALALWTMPVMAAFRGYFQGQGRMGPSAVSQVAEQTVRVAAMVTLLLAGLHAGWSDAKLAAGATAGSAFGGLAGLAVLLFVYRREPERGRSRLAAAGGGQGRLRGFLADARLLAAVGLPAALASLAVPVAGIVDAFTVPRLLAAELSGSGSIDAAGASAEAMRAFGLYSRGQPLVQLVVMVAGAAAAAMIPALASARRQGGEASRVASGSAALAVRLAWQIGAAASVGLVLLAEPVNVMLYADAEATGTLAIVGSAAWAGTLGAVTAAVLQGHGRVRAAAALIVLGALLKAALNAALVPPLGLAGAAWAGALAFAAPALLGAALVRRSRSGGPAAGGAGTAAAAAGTAAALAAMAAALWLLQRSLAALPAFAALPPRAAAAAHALAGVLLGVAVFGPALLRFGGLRAADVRALPAGAKLAARLGRLGLLPRR